MINFKETEIVNMGECKKLKEILGLIFKRDNEFYSKLRNILTTNFLNYFVTILEKISELVNKNSQNDTQKIFIDK